MNTIGPNYQSWVIDESEFPQSGPISDRIEFILKYGILAPSTHNSQPWLFEISDSELIVRPSMSYVLPFSDSAHRDLYMSLGACVANIVIAANHFSLGTEIEVREEDPLTSSIKVLFSNQKTNPETESLFESITKRFSDKRILPDQEIPSAKLEKLSGIASRGNVLISTDRSLIKELSAEYLTAAREFARNPGFVRELRLWMRGNNTKLGDGMPGSVSGLSNGKAVIGKAALKLNPKIMQAMAKKYEELIITSPAVGVISTAKDDIKSWVDAGMSLEWLALTATYEGITVCPMAAMVENDQRKDLEALFPGSNHIQIFFRLAVADQKAGFLHTPRRSVSKAIISSQNMKKIIPVKASSHFIMIGDKRIHYITCGSGDPLLLIHGANIGWGQWYPNLAALSQHNKVFALDLPGCGDSGDLDFHKLDFERDFVTCLKQFIQDLGLKELSVIGHSVGGTIAVKLSKDPDLDIKKIILVDPMGIINYVPPKQKIASVYPAIKLVSRTAMKPTRKNMTSFLLSVLGDDPSLDPRFIDYYHASVERSRTNHPLLLISGLVKKFRIKPEILILDDLGGLKLPVLIVMGDQDPLIPVSKVKAALGESVKSNLVVFSGTGHVPSLEKPKEFDSLAVNFLAKGAV